ncbi:MAG TPA: insulinase family protein [Kofleriaceae bacterium]
MDLVQRGSRWLGVLAVAAAGCSSPRPPIRFGSLAIEGRSFTYAHGVQSFHLANGLIVALSPDPRANLVGVDVRYLIGAADDPPGKSGLAHLAEHMTFEHREQPDGPTLHDLLTASALSHNADTNWDATHYHELALADRLDDLLAVELTRMTAGCAGLDQATFERERGVVLQELAQRGDAGLVDTILGDLFGVHHRYARGLGGRDVASLTLADVCSFIAAHYAPNRAILVVTGRMDPDAVHRAVGAQFGAVTRRSIAAHPAIRPPVLTGRVTEHQADTDDAAAVVLFPAAPWGSPEAFDDALVDSLLAGRLEGLDRDQPWITGIETGVLGGRRAGARFFAVSVDDPARLDEAVGEVFRAARDIPGDDPDLALGTIAARWRSQLFDRFESVAERGTRCADYLQFTRHNRFHLRELAELQSIDLDRLRQRAARLTRSGSHVVRILPAHHQTHTVRAQLRSATLAIDAPVWQTAVDPAEAERPLALPAEPRPVGVSELRLTNGLRVLMASDFTQPVFEARVVFPIGDFNVGPGRADLADAAAELLTHDFARGYTIQEYATIDWVMRLGARMSAEVDESTTFAVRGTSTFADWHLWRLHWLLENGTYPYVEVTQANEAAARRALHPSFRRSWWRALREAVYGREHPYARATDRAGPPDVDGDDLEAFREAHYRASGATLILVGKFDPGAMRRTVTELFGAWSAEPPPPPQPIPAMHPAAGPTWIAHTDPDAAQVRITLVFAATSPRMPARGARTVVAEMVRSRLDQVRTRLGASYGIQTSYQWSEAGDIVYIDGYVDADRAGEVLGRMQADLEGLRAGDDAFAADFVRARRTTLGRALAAPMMSSTVADHLEVAVSHHLPLDAAAALPGAIAQTTLAAARDVIAADLRPERMVVLLSGRPAATAAALQAAGVTRFQTVEDGAAHRR